jgi:hypothetical protein
MNEVINVMNEFDTDEQDIAFVGHHIYLISLNTQELLIAVSNTTKLQVTPQGRHLCAYRYCLSHS